MAEDYYLEKFGCAGVLFVVLSFAFVPLGAWKAVELIWKFIQFIISQ